MSASLDPINVAPIPPDPTVTEIDSTGQPVNVVIPQPITKYARFDLMTILNKIFLLLTDIIGDLQSVAASQADRLQFLTSWQEAYTDKLNQIPTFVGGPGAGDTGSPIESSSTSDSNAREDLNQLNTAFTNQLQGDRSIVEDDAKSLQASVNQSNDEVNQQSDLATSIIQQFSTILGAIFR